MTLRKPLVHAWPIFLAVALTLAACADPGGPSAGTTGLRITTTTTGLDYDPNGYLVAVDGYSHGVILPNDTRLMPVRTGRRTIALQGLAPNCTIDGPPSRTLSVSQIPNPEVEFAIVCTATSGVIGVSVRNLGTDSGASYRATVDGSRSLPIPRSGLAYLDQVSSGVHTLVLTAPGGCVVLSNSVPVTVTVGGLARDTAKVGFAVNCGPNNGALNINVVTRGPEPQAYTAIVCYDFYCDAMPTFLNALPNGIVTVPLPPSPIRITAFVNLRGVPANCGVQSPTRASGTRTVRGDTINIAFEVVCSP